MIGSNQPVIFTAFANPGNTLEFLNQEQNGLQDIFRPLEEEGKIKKHLIRTDTDIEAYFSFLAEWKDQVSIFHFGGHSNSEGLTLQDTSAFFAPLAKELADRNENALQLVFLNGCSTYFHVKTLFDFGIKVVLATCTTIDDDIATQFSLRFYRNLASGDSIHAAYKSAANFISVKAVGDCYRSLGEVFNVRGTGFDFNEKSHAHDFPWGLYLNGEPAILEKKLFSGPPTTSPTPNFTSTKNTVSGTYAEAQTIIIGDNNILTTQGSPTPLPHSSVLQRPTNEKLTKSLIESLSQYNTVAQKILRQASSDPEWEKDRRVITSAKSTIQQIFAGIIGEELRSLFSIGSKEFSDETPGIYTAQCLQLVKRSLDLVSFAFISKLWEQQKNISTKLTQEEQEIITDRFDFYFELSIEKRLHLLKVLVEIFSKPEYSLPIVFPEMSGYEVFLSPEHILFQSCIKLDQINRSYQEHKKTTDYLTAELLLVDFFKYFHFLSKYKIVSIRDLSYEYVRHLAPQYIHRYIVLGANKGDFKANYSNQHIYTNAVLLFSGENYHESINLSPFVIDYNALIINNDDNSSKICFYKSYNPGDDSLDFVSIEDNHTISVFYRDILNQSKNETDLLTKEYPTLNLDRVVEQFREAQKCLCGETNCSQ